MSVLGVATVLSVNGLGGNSQQLRQRRMPKVYQKTGHRANRNNYPVRIGEK